MYNFDIDIEAILNQLNQQPERTRTGNHHRSTVVGESPFPSPWRWLQVMGSIFRNRFIGATYHIWGLYFRPKFQGIFLENMARNMVRLRTSINWIPKFPSIQMLIPMLLCSKPNNKPSNKSPSLWVVSAPVDLWHQGCTTPCWAEVYPLVN